MYRTRVQRKDAIKQQRRTNKKKRLAPPQLRIDPAGSSRRRRSVVSPQVVTARQSEASRKNPCPPAREQNCQNYHKNNVLFETEKQKEPESNGSGQFSISTQKAVKETTNRTADIASSNQRRPGTIVVVGRCQTEPETVRHRSTKEYH